MYFWGFIKALFKPRNLPSVLFLIANNVIIFYLFTWMNFPFPYRLNGLVAVGVNIIFTFISISPLGEAIM